MSQRIDKSQWPAGPWQSEPDRVEFRHEGFPCLMVREMTSGHWCGYVGVPPGHPWHGVELDDSDERPSVHGGITYSRACSGEVCHRPAPGEPEDVFWQGFDCHHDCDLGPGDLVFNAKYGFSSHGNVYRDLAYVKAEVERLAVQAKEAAP